MAPIFTTFCVSSTLGSLASGQTRFSRQQAVKRPAAITCCSDPQRSARLGAIREEASLNDAERTRRALSANRPMVKFRRGEVEDVERESSFEYTSGVQAGIDVWLIAGILALLVPAVVLIAGIQGGLIDAHPR